MRGLPRRAVCYANTCRQHVKDAALRRYKDAALRRYKDATLRRVKDATLRRYKDATLRRYKDAALRRVKDATPYNGFGYITNVNRIVGRSGVDMESTPTGSI